MVATVNFDNEIAFFTEIIENVGNSRVLTIQGECFTGKTTLLSTYKNICEKCNCKNVTINLKRPLDPHGMLDHLVDIIGREYFPNYWKLSEKIAFEGAKLNISKNILVLSFQRISVSSKEQHLALNRHLAMEFFKDAKSMNCDKTIVFLFDHYEHAIPTTKEWMVQEFLPEICESPLIAAVVVGQEVPNTHLEWHKAHRHFVLKGIESKYWEEYVSKIGARLSREEIQLLHNDYDGVPGLMVTKIHQLHNIRSSNDS